MKTRIVVMDEQKPDEAALRYAGRLIRTGGIVAFPTETVYGLGGNALDPYAAERIYDAKRRPREKAMTVHIADADALFAVAADISDGAKRLAEKLWPGPLTMIFKKRALVPDAVTGGKDTVGVRFPSNEIARRVIRAGGGFVAAPSANISGRPSPRNARDVIRDLDGRVDMIIDGGAARHGIESTILDMTGESPVMLREGCYSAEDIFEASGLRVV